VRQYVPLGPAGSDFMMIPNAAGGKDIPNRPQPIAPFAFAGRSCNVRKGAPQSAPAVGRG
jgi:hypothetical protein